MSKKLYVTVGAMKSLVQQLVKESGDPAFVTEPPVAAPPIESDARSSVQVDQGMLPVEDPEWEPSTQDELINAVTQYAGRTPTKQLGDVWSNVRDVIDDAVERDEAGIDDDINEVAKHFNDRHGRCASSYASHLIREAINDEDVWNVNVPGWNPDDLPDDLEGTPFDQYGTDVDLRPTAKDKEVATKDAAEDAAEQKRLERITADRLVRHVPEFWRGGKSLDDTVAALRASGDNETNIGTVRNLSLRIREKLKFMNSLEPDQVDDLRDDAVDQWIEVARETGSLSPEELTVVANDPSIIEDLPGFLEILDSVVVSSMEQTLKRYGYEGGELEAEEKLGFRGWKGISQSPFTGQRKLLRATTKLTGSRGKPATRVPTGPKVPPATPELQAMKRGTSMAGATTDKRAIYERMLADAQKVGNETMINAVKQMLASLGPKE